jgi:uncharacterized protein
MIIYIIGFLSGMISGMGIGGGTILIPGLLLVTSISQQLAQSVNLAAFLPTALIAIYVHHKNKNIDFILALWLILSGLIGAWLGSCIAIGTASSTLRKLFGIFLLIMGIYEFFYKEKDQS